MRQGEERRGQHLFSVMSVLTAVRFFIIIFPGFNIV